MDLHLAELSRTIDPTELGRRIRTARVAAGMTQGQVAAGEVTAAYLSRIEDGQRRPEAGLLARMAARMGVSLEDLLLDVPRDTVQELRLAVDLAELSLASGDGPGALTAIDTLLADPALDHLADLRRAALQVRAGALEVTGELDRAILVLEELARAATRDAHWVRSLIALSRCYRDAGELDRAIRVGKDAAAAISAAGLEGLTESIQLTVTVAAAYHCQGDTGEAMRMCMRALDAAEKYDSPVAKASAYWNASAVETTTNGATAHAVAMAQKALALFEIGDDNRNLAKLRAQTATLHLAADPPDAQAALAVLETAEQELTRYGASAWEVALVHVTRGRAHFLLGNHGDALESAQRGIELAPASAALLRASAAAVMGQVAVAEGRSEDARAHYRTAILALTAAGSDRRAAQLWFDLATLLTEVGDTEGALEAFRNAGASTGLRARATPSHAQRR